VSDQDSVSSVGLLLAMASRRARTVSRDESVLKARVGTFMPTRRFSVSMVLNEAGSPAIIETDDRRNRIPLSDQD